MGREIRRVPLDFSCPLNEPWKGFLNPHYKPCPGENVTCFNGYSAAGQWLDSLCRMISLIGEEAAAEPYAYQLRARGRLYPHPYLEQWAQAPRFSVPRDVEARLRAIKDEKERMTAYWRYSREHPAKLLPFTPELLQFVTALAGGREPSLGSGTDWAVKKALWAAAGVTDIERWGVCKICNGDTMDPAVKELYENWKEEPPPTGPGWQLWETVSEGSPISPVFPDEPAFTRYLIDQGYSEKAATNFIKMGSIHSMTTFTAPGEETKVYKDIEAAEVLG